LGNAYTQRKLSFTDAYIVMHGSRGERETIPTYVALGERNEDFFAVVFFFFFLRGGFRNRSVGLEAEDILSSLEGESSLFSCICCTAPVRPAYFFFLHS